MKITIDTKEDSHEEIRKIIRMLSSLVGDEVMTNQGNIFSDSSAQAGSTDMFSMFSANSESSEKKPEENIKQAKQDDIEIDIPDIEPYD